MNIAALVLMMMNRDALYDSYADSSASECHTGCRPVNTTIAAAAAAAVAAATTTTPPTPTAPTTTTRMKWALPLRSCRPHTLHPHAYNIYFWCEDRSQANR